MSQLGKYALIVAAVVLLAPVGAAAASDSPLDGPFSIEAGLRHGPERIADVNPPQAPLGSPYAYQFESGLEPAPTFVADGTLPDGMTLSEGGLLSGVPTVAGRFFFVVFASNGQSEGTEQQVTIQVVAPPQATTEPANAYAPAKAVLIGWVNPGNLAAQAWFEYWPAETPGSVVKTPVDELPASVKQFEVEAKLEGLVPAIAYDFRLAAANGLSPDPVYSETKSLKTALPPPQAGESFNIEPAGGTVSTKCAGEGDFTKLKSPKQVTLDCQIDTTDGTVSLTASKGSSGDTQSANFWGGLFSVFQEKGDNKEAVLNLAGGLRCERKKKKKTGGHARIASAGRKGKGGRKLWGSGEGNYKTVGNHGAGTVRGTIWLVADRCDGSTLFKVKRGTVAVRDFFKKTTFLLEAGESYVAKVVGGRLP